jgi:hypothetical protein
LADAGGKYALRRDYWQVAPLLAEGQRLTPVRFSAVAIARHENPLVFETVRPKRESWESISAAAETAVKSLAP